MTIIAAIEDPPMIGRILTLSVCPPEHRPEHGRGPSIDSNWPAPIPDPIRFSR